MAYNQLKVITVNNNESMDLEVLTTDVRFIKLAEINNCKGDNNWMNVVTKNESMLK